MVGSIEPKKNHVFVLDELAPILAREGGDARLTIVGRLGWLHEPIVRRIDEACREGDVRWLQDCDDDGLLALYAEADALIQASQAEGFGLPIIEAAAMGSPVICSRHPTAREVAPPDARFFDLRPGDLAATVAALDRPALAQWKAAIAQRPWRSWAETVSEVFDVILRMA
jgi:glycosyltransferase involved in cell wall biosynthesis